MPVRIPRINNGNVPLLNTGVRVARTAQLEIDNGSLGRGLQAVGNVVADIQADMARANDTRVMLTAEKAMRDAVMEQTSFQQQNPDESAWLNNWSGKGGIVSRLQSTFDKEKLTPNGRLALERSFGAFADQHNIAIQGQAFGQSQRRARVALDLSVQDAVDAGDVEGVRRAQSLAGGTGMLPEEQQAYFLDKEKEAKAAREKRIADEVKTLTMEENSDAADAFLEEHKDELDSNTYRQLSAQVKYGTAVRDDIRKADEMIAVDPKQAAIDLDSKPGMFPYLTEGQRKEKAREAKAMLAAESTDALEGIAQKIEMGEITQPEQIPTDKLTPYMEFQAKKMLAQKQAMSGKDDPGLFADFVADIANFSPNPEAGGMDIADMRAGIKANFTTDYAAQLLEQFDNQLEGKGLDIPVAESLALVKNATFGAEERQAVDEEGFPLVKTVKEKSIRPGWFGGTKTVETEREVPDTVVDPIKKAKGDETRAKINKQVEKEIRAGELETEEEIRNRTIQLIIDAGGALPKEIGGAPLSMEGTLPGMPSGGMDSGNPLLPDITQQAISILDANNQ